MGNDQTCKAVGIGIVILRITDGAERTLLNVRHVPTL